MDEFSNVARDNVLHRGGCHCGNVRFSVEAPAVLDVWDCNCSICKMKRNTHFIVPASQFHLQSSSEPFLTLYEFGTQTAKHLFCKVCGVCSFYRPRSNPDGVAVTVHCLDEGTVESVNVKAFDGTNWDKAYNESDIAEYSAPQGLE